MKDKDIKVGALVAFNTLPDAAWFEVVDIHEKFHLIVREYDRDHNTDYAKQVADRSMVKQVKERA